MEGSSQFHVLADWHAEKHLYSQSRSVCFAEENIFPLSRIGPQSPGRSAPIETIVPNMISWFLRMLVDLSGRLGSYI